MNLKEFCGYCFDEIGERKGYTRYRNSWFKLENEILLGFGMHKCRGPYFQIEFEIMPLVCGVYIERDGQMLFQTYGPHSARTNEKLSLHTDFHDKEYCNRAREYALHVFEQSVEPFLDGVHDLASAYEMQWAFRESGSRDGREFKRISMEDHVWLSLCALKRYDDCLLNAKGCAEMRGLTELHEGFGLIWRLQCLLRDKNYAAIDAILEENKQNSLARLKKCKIIR